MGKVVQTGLYTTDEEALVEFADRVSDYNIAKGFLAVEMEGRESDPDELCDEPHFKIRLEFRSRPYARDFWVNTSSASSREEH